MLEAATSHSTRVHNGKSLTALAMSAAVYIRSESEIMNQETHGR